ncbi:MAG: sugar ABC transporter ATP-binding protein [Anaerolineae bacterium]|nr:sugar ABC transporter ATP-binding protein [Anaerolineae bacterium]
MSENLLELKGISKSFPGVQALDNVDFDLRPGEVHALVGENGAGKSTLVKVITGVHQPDAGEIRFQGQPVTFPNPLVAQQHGVAAIYQEPTLFPDLSVGENIFIGHQPVRPMTRRMDWKRLYERAGELLNALGVKLDPRTRVRGLSVAQQQMVEIAKALSLNARILIMDEPTSALTLRDVEDLFRITRRLREAGTAIVFISHRLEEAFELADRITVLRDGHYVGTRPVPSTTTDEVIQMMVGRTLDTLFPKEEVEIGEVMLRVEGLTKEGLFHDVSFELRRGEILGLAGLVGARRTDVARAIFGISPADSGSIWVDSRQVRISNPQEALALGIVYVPEDRQQQGLVLPMDITQNITLPILREFARRGGWLDNSAERETAQEFAERLDVRAAGLWQKVQQLSGGNQQKVVLAKWLAARPHILILDEPTRGIDVGTKAAVHELMSKLAGQGMSILMISSELPEILGMSDRIVVMYEGRVTAHFTRQEATQEKIMAAATGQPFSNS